MQWKLVSIGRSTAPAKNTNTVVNTPCINHIMSFALEICNMVLVPKTLSCLTVQNNFLFVAPGILQVLLQLTCLFEHIYYVWKHVPCCNVYIMLFR